MNVFYNPLHLSWLHFQSTIYRIFLAVVSLLLFLNPCYGQEIGAYKTRTSGDFNQTSTWEVWDGSNWNDANQLPGAKADIYVDRLHTLRLTAPEAVKNLFLFSGTGAGQKLNLNGFNMDVYGVLAGFTGTVPGLPRGAWNNQNWIGNSTNSTLTFKGESRVIVDKASWSAQTTQSRFGVIFDPGPDQELVLQAPFKALFFRVRSGSLYQKNDLSSSSSPCFTLSFNTETSIYGSGPFGTFTVEAGATFRSGCSAQVIHRTGSNPALLFDLQRDATLLLEGQYPKIEAANFTLEGSLIFRGNQGPMNFLSSSLSSSSKPNLVRHLVVDGKADLLLPTNLVLQGNLQELGQGSFQLAPTQLTLSGSEDQFIRTKTLLLGSLILHKPTGKVSLNCDLRIYRSLRMVEGILDFQGHDLLLNTSSLGTFSYQAGSWHRLRQLTYFGLPSLLTPTSGSFPFEDLANGGFRGLQVLGPTPLEGNLSIQFIEQKGANHDANFQDVDGTEIVYQLHSYFQVSGNPRLGQEELELRISADSLLLDQVGDLRVVSREMAAPGLPIPGVLDGYPWAKRRLKWVEFSDAEFTIGSYREASVLPIRKKN
ncbi:MAG: hypothetical protein O2829_04625 [Bacteroidetes bacterium]|nr:hypothetical protein [Bacteroidota bacterium]MDA1268359.1 hypothetical protein [Bacteroidota bacterium]